MHQKVLDVLFELAVVQKYVPQKAGAHGNMGTKTCGPIPGGLVLTHTLWGVGPIPSI